MMFKSFRSSALIAVLLSLWVTDSLTDVYAKSPVTDPEAVQPVSASKQDNSAARLAIQEITVTAFRVERDLSEFPGSMSLLDSDSLAMSAHTHIQESLNRLPGVNFHRNSGQEYLAAVRSPVLTGAGSCGSLMTAEDGLSLRPVGFCNVNELFEAHSEQATRIEVIRGPASAAYGSKSMHGVINLIDPVDLDGPTTSELELGAYGFRRAKLSGATDTQSGARWGAAFTGTTETGYRDDTGYDQQKLSLRHQSMAGAILVDTRLTATHLNQETAGFISGENSYQDPVASRTNPNPEAFRDARAVRLTSRISGPDQRWQIQPYGRYSDMAFLQHFLPGQPLEENGHYSAGVLSQYQFQDAETVKVIVGLDLEYAHSWLRQSQQNPTRGSAFLQETIPAGLHYNYKVQSSVAGAYLQSDWTLTNELSLGLGVRAEQVQYQYENLMLDGRSREDGSACDFGGCRYSRPGDTSNRFTNLSPKLSLSYAPDQRTLFYARSSSGYRAPEMTELYRLQRDQETTDLDSEKLISLELGWRYSHVDSRYELALFDMKKSNVILRDTDFFNLSRGKTTHRGAELMLQRDLTDRLQLAVAATYAVHKYANNPGLSAEDVIGNDVDSAPRLFGSSRLSYGFNQTLSVELEWQHMDRYFTDAENLHEYAGHDLVNLRSQWAISDRWSGSLRLNNLFNSGYAERADYSSFSGDRYLPGMPRRIYIGVEYQLPN